MRRRGALSIGHRCSGQSENRTRLDSASPLPAVQRWALAHAMFDILDHGFWTAVRAALSISFTLGLVYWAAAEVRRRWVFATEA